MRFNKEHIGPFLGKLPFGSLAKSIRKLQHIPFLPFYHSLEFQASIPHISPIYSPRKVEEFKNDLDFILQYFKAISLEELILFKNGEIRFDRPVFHLSFDDGLREVYELAMPILIEKGIPATLFVNPDFIDNKALFFRYQLALMSTQQIGNIPSASFLEIRNHEAFEQFTNQYNIVFDSKPFLREYQPYMTFSQVEDWVSKGFTVGGHSMSHPNYQYISLERQLEETVKSVDYVMDSFQMKYRAFAFPFEDLGVKKAFFEKIEKRVDISFGTSGVKSDDIPFHYQRTCMEKGRRTAADIIRSEYAYYQWARWIGRHKMKRD